MLNSLNSIEINQLVDSVYYERKYGINRAESATHYLEYGWKQGLNPHELFDTKYYLEKNNDVLTSGSEPFAHFIRYGITERRNPHPLLDLKHFFNQNEAKAAQELTGYFKKNLEANRYSINPHPLFDHNVYYSNCKNKPLIDPPFLSFLEEIGACATQCHELFNPMYYCTKSFKWQTNGNGNPLRFYIETEDYSSETSELFDTQYYFKTYLQNSKISPQLHYLAYGHIAGYSPHLFFDEKWYKKNYSFANGSPSLLDYLRRGHLLNYSPSMWINEKYVKEITQQEKPSLSLQIVDELNNALLDPNPYFNKAWYRIAHDSSKPLTDYINSGFSNKKKISYNFNVEDFLSNEGTYNLEKISKAFQSEIMKQKNDRDRILAPEIITGIFGKTNNTPLKKIDLPLTNTDLTNFKQSKNIESIKTVKISDVLVKIGSRLMWKLNSTSIIHDEYYNLYRDSNLSPKSSNEFLSADGKRLSTTITTPSYYISDAYHLMHEYDRNYYHFILELLPKLITYKTEGRSNNVLISDDLHRNLLYLIKGIVPKGRIIQIKRNEWVHCENLEYAKDKIVCLDVYNRVPKINDIVYDKEAIQQVREYLLSFSDISNEKKQERIILQRNSGARLPINQNEIIEELVNKFGFESVDPTNLDIMEQMNIFSSAKYIVSPTGACLTNLIVCNPGTKLIVLFPDTPKANIQIWSKLGYLFNVDVIEHPCNPIGKYVSKYTMHDDYIINTKSFFEKIKSVLQYD